MCLQFYCLYELECETGQLQLASKEIENEYEMRGNLDSRKDRFFKKLEMLEQKVEKLDLDLNRFFDKSIWTIDEHNQERNLPENKLQRRN